MGSATRYLSNSKRLLDSSKSHRFYKPFALFPTGQQVMQGAAEAVLARSKDAGFLHDLKSTIASAASLPPEPSVKVVDDAMAIARVAEYRQLFQALAKLKAAGSERFKSTNKGELAELQNNLDKLTVAVDAVWKQGLNSSLQKVPTHFVKAWSVKASVKHFNDAVDVVMNKTLDPKVFLKGIADELTIKSFAEIYDNSLGVASSLHSVYPNMVSKSWALGAEDANLIALYEILEDPNSNGSVLA